MPNTARDENEPDWLGPANDRKTPYTDAELDRLASDFLAMNKDVAVWKALVAKVGMQRNVGESGSEVEE